MTTTQRHSSCEWDQIRYLGAVNEPGQIALLAGIGEPQFCLGTLWAFDVRGPRGRTLLFEDAFAEFVSGKLEPLPDSDGDGLDDERPRAERAQRTDELAWR